MRTPAISVITPSFNQARFIEETLRSVKNQRYPALEHIVIDGCSTDGTVDILRRYCSSSEWAHVSWISEQDRGQTDALNKGFRMASGEIIGWLNSDDLFEDGCLAKVSAMFESNNSVDFVYGDYRIIDGNGRPLILKREIGFDWDIMLCGLNYIAQPNVFFRRRVFDELGYLDDSLHYVMDYEFWLRAASRGLSFLHVPQTFAACRWHLDAKTVSRHPRIEQELKSVRRKYWNKLQFRNGSIQAGYEKCCNLKARVVRQWKKLSTRRVVDFVPASLYLDVWKKRERSRQLRPA